MLRFPNPGSTTANLVAVYCAAFQALNGKIVDLDDMVKATVDANLATSSGYMGNEAIARSTREDRSRDGLYNLLKMYAELYRALGWLHSTENSALNYTFTLLGRQIVAAGDHYLPLLGETVLGISYPSHVLSIKGVYKLRPFALILKTMLACDDGLSRDEMIIGPLAAADDSSKNHLDRLKSQIAKARKSPESISSMVDKIADVRGIQVNTLQNYTRFPIAIMRDCGWTEKARYQFRATKQTFEVHRLTVKGKEVANRVVSSVDIRLNQFDKLPGAQKTALSLHAHYQMLERAGFNIQTVTGRLEQQRPNLIAALNSFGTAPDKPLLFSPFQSLSLTEINQIFPTAPAVGSIVKGGTPVVVGQQQGRDPRDHLFVKPHFVPKIGKAAMADDSALLLHKVLLELRKRHSSDGEAASAFTTLRIADSQTEFYPLISQLFRLMGFKSEHSRAGVNYQRWDACVWVDNIALPVEIKSPTEELYLSTKAIRQALENKIILLSRGGLNTEQSATSLIVGYQIPNERGDMASLVDDVFSAFKIRIGIIDLSTLVLLAIRAVTQNLTVSPAQLKELKGFLHV